MQEIRLFWVTFIWQNWEIEGIQAVTADSCIQVFRMRCTIIG